MSTSSCCTYVRLVPGKHLMTRLGGSGKVHVMNLLLGWYVVLHQ